MPHTPGPWVAQRDWESVFNPDPEELEFYMKRPITAIRSLTADKDVALCHDLFEFNPDDARLMAAAPDLLEALEKLASTLDSLSLSDEEAWTSDLVVARAAIAKAKGE